MQIVQPSGDLRVRFSTGKIWTLNSDSVAKVSVYGYNGAVHTRTNERTNQDIPKSLPSFWPYKGNKESKDSLNVLICTCVVLPLSAV